MKLFFRLSGNWPLALVLMALGTGWSARSAEAATDTNDLVPLKLKLPEPSVVGTPRDIPLGSNVEAPSKTPRPPLMVPKDVKNVAPGSKITSSDSNATPALLAKLVDGDKEAQDASIILLRKGPQWVQFDLGSPQEIYAIVVWHAHDQPKVYHSVVVQAADDPEMKTDLHTLFNNDTENADKQGAGTDREYFETREGKLIDAKGVKARYVRLWSKGSSDGAINEYTEVEIYARPAK